MIKTTRNVLTPKGILHVYEVYDDGTNSLVDTLRVKYVIMGMEFATIGDISKVFGMPTNWSYDRISRYWSSPHGFPATWRELVGLECFDPEAISEAKRATRAAAYAIIAPRLANLPTDSLGALLTGRRRLVRVFEPIVRGVE